ncbi:hypothetical protein R6Q59_011764 [Mikania micrantha]
MATAFGTSNAAIDHGTSLRPGFDFHVFVLEMDLQFDILDELTYVKHHLSNWTLHWSSNERG